MGKCLISIVKADNPFLPDFLRVYGVDSYESPSLLD